MTFFETLRVAWEALLANKLRSALTMLGIIIGVGSVIAVIAIGRGTQAAVVGELQGLGGQVFQIFPGGDPTGRVLERVEPFREQDIQTLKGLLPDVDEVISFLQFTMLVRHEKNNLQAPVIGGHAVMPEVLNQKLKEGRWFSPVEERAGARVAVLSADSVEKLFGDSEAQAVGKLVSINGLPFQVIGVLAKETGMLSKLVAPDDTSLYVPITFVQRLTGYRDLSTLLVKVKPGADPETVMKDAIALMERSHGGAKYTGFTFSQVTASLSSVTGILTGVVAAIAGISLVVGGVGIMNIMLVSVTERTREVGLRKAIGATYRDVLVQFLIEAVVLCLVGGAVGVGLASIPVFFVGRWLEISLLMDWKSVALALGFSVAVGVVFGVYPASKAARLDPIEALRYE
ncbi:MAG: ABC transporter permease [Bacillota bacterium]